MKNKKLTYFVLVPAVLIIWGIIIYKIVVKDEDFTTYEVSSNTAKRENPNSTGEMYQLINNYPDPFLCETSYSEENYSEEVPEPTKPKVVNKWPTIRFNGSVFNKDKARCHLTVNGEDKIFQIKEVVLDGYLISVITSDSVQISYQGNSRWFKK